VRLSLVVAMILAPAAAFAAPRSAADCAAIENAFAYNACIAQFGPVPGQQHYTQAPPTGQVPVATASTPGRAAPAYRGATRVRGTVFTRRGSHGRMIAEFQVGPSAAAPQPRRTWRRRYYRR
jgi:hypothetical protein